MTNEQCPPSTLTTTTSTASDSVPRKAEGAVLLIPRCLTASVICRIKGYGLWPTELRSWSHGHTCLKQGDQKGGGGGAQFEQHVDGSLGAQLSPGGAHPKHSALRNQPFLCIIRPVTSVTSHCPDVRLCLYLHMLPEQEPHLSHGSCHRLNVHAPPKFMCSNPDPQRIELRPGDFGM